MKEVTDTAELVQLGKATPAAKTRPSGVSTVGAFLKCQTCSKTLMHVVDRELDEPLKLEESSVDPLAGGLMQGYQCGMLWGSTLAAGAQAHRLYGSGPRAEGAAMRAAHKLVDSFRARTGHTNCLEITETHPQDKWKVLVHFLLKGGTLHCFGLAARWAPEALDAIDSGISDEPHAACNPASCAAELARRAGASDKQAVMAAGLAGGIGLSGGACGALGAAIWILGMRGREAGEKNKSINARINETMESFLKASQYAYECSEIVGRTFEGIEDHAAHVRRGGCSKILDRLAAQLQQSETSKAA